jgi:hypothetical protein
MKLSETQLSILQLLACPPYRRWRWDDVRNRVTARPTWRTIGALVSWNLINADVDDRGDIELSILTAGIHALNEHNARAVRCADCGAAGEHTGHQECQFPADHP